MIDLHVVEAKPPDASDVLGVVHAAFGARPPLDPPSTALGENTASVERALAKGGGLLAKVHGEPAGAIIFDPTERTAATGSDEVGVAGSLRGRGWLELRRVSVHPAFQRRGVATAMVGCAEEVAEARGLCGVRLIARAEFPDTVEFWERRGYVEADRSGAQLVMAKRIGFNEVAETPDDMHRLGERLATALRAGDLVLLSGELGAGKTTLTQGLGAGLGVQGAITSPTFVLARVHRPVTDGPALVHADAYRLGGIDELDDLDLDASVADSVTVVEWGEGVAEGLSDDRLAIHITRATGAAASGGVHAADSDASMGDPEGTDPREVRITPVGRRWVAAAC